MTHPYNQASWFLAPLVNTPGFDTSTTRLQMLDNMGRLVPAQVDGAASLPSVEGCQQVLPGASLTMPLEHEVIPWLHTVAIDYVAQRAGLITVAIGTGDPVTTDVQAGAHQVYVRAEGGDASVTITSTDAQLCVGSLEVGRVLPSDLPYRGTADVTDALRDLQNGASG